MKPTKNGYLEIFSVISHFPRVSAFCSLLRRLPKQFILASYFHHGRDTCSEQTVLHASQKLRQGVSPVLCHWPKGWKWPYQEIRHQHEKASISGEGDGYGLGEIQLK